MQTFAKTFEFCFFVNLFTFVDCQNVEKRCFMKVIVIDKVHNYLIEKLSDYGVDVADYQDVMPEEARQLIFGYEGIVLRSKIKLTGEILQNLPNLKFIARVGAGMESIDTETAKSLNIELINAPEGNRDSLAEHSVAMLLTLFNKICQANTEVKKGIWQREPNRGIELMGKTVGIIGYGNMGSAFARRLSGFGVQVISYDKYKMFYADGFTKEVKLDDIYNDVDVLSLNVPLTDETLYMFDNQFISHFRKPFYLLNTSRGKVVKTKDLVESLKSGKVLGAALDVLEYENVSFDVLSDAEMSVIEYLQSAENVLLTPHIAGLTVESNLKLAKVIADRIIYFLEKK